LVWTYVQKPTLVEFQSGAAPGDLGSGVYTTPVLTLVRPARTSPLDFPALSTFDRLGGLFGAAIIAGVLFTAVAAAARYRRDVVRDGREALASLGTVSAGLAAGLGMFALATRAYLGDAVPRDLVAGAMPVVAAILATVVPVRLRPGLLGGAVLAIAAIGYTGREAALPTEYLVTVALLLTIAAASVGIGGRVATARTGLVAVATLAVLGAVSWANVAGSGGFQWTTYGPDPMQLYAVAAVALVPTLLWAPVVVLRSATGWIAALVATAAGLVWLGIEAGFAAVDASTFIAAIASCTALLGIARLATRPIRRRTAV
jgi:hypothetical protein